jgi:hypothetical protein
VKWTVDSQISWPRHCARSNTRVYCITDMVTGALRRKKLGIRFDDDTPYYDTLAEAWWTNADLKLIRSTNITNQ